MNKSLRICIDARHIDGESGGIQQVAIGLADGFSNLLDGDEEYFFLVYSGASEYLEPYIRGPCRLLCVTPLSNSPKWKKVITSLASSLLNVCLGFSPSIGTKAISLPHSEGIIEETEIALMHFTHQSAFLTDVPSIYHPHDLQHLHLPDLFTPLTRAVREIRYRKFCEQAKMIAVASSWVKEDIVKHYGTRNDKVWVVPLASPAATYPLPKAMHLIDAKEKFSLPQSFGFYPAQTWAHKNHIGLVKALAVLRDQRGLRVPFVFSGRVNEYFGRIEKMVRELHLTDQIQFLGFVSPLELQCFYRLCRCVVIPTQFEAGSFPLFEAFHAGAPVACSNVTSLPVQAADAALIFDPNDTLDIANAIEQLWIDETLRNNLIERGRERSAAFSWEKTARLFRAHYRRLGGLNLNEEDQHLLSQPSLM